MARFIFSMQDILNMKEKLEEQAKNNFAQANRSLQEALLMQKQCENSLEAGKQTLKEAMLENIGNNKYFYSKRLNLPKNSTNEQVYKTMISSDSPLLNIKDSQDLIGVMFGYPFKKLKMLKEKNLRR